MESMEVGFPKWEPVTVCGLGWAVQKSLVTRGNPQGTVLKREVPALPPGYHKDSETPISY